MLLTVTTTAPPATDLGYLLHKSPARAHTFSLTFGKAHVFYPAADEHRCTAALLVEVDPVGLVRGKAHGIEQYVNDRPYAASSFLSVAISEVFGSAMAGRSKERPELAERALPLETTVHAVSSRGGEPLLRKLFEPLGYALEATSHALDDWGPSRYFDVTLRGEHRLRDLLTHLYVLLPVLDDDKHYWVGDDEVAKLVRHGEGWLPAHPERELIAKRYLKHQKSLARQAMEQLIAEELAEPDEAAAAHAREEAHIEERISLNEQRVGAVIAALKQCGAKRVLDLGCGEGQLLRALKKDRTFAEIVGVDVSHRSLEIARDKLRLDDAPDLQKDRVKLLQGSLAYRDRRLSGYDAAAVVEVIEHLDAHRLASFERALFEHARPQTVVLTTPNAEYNVRFESLPAGRLRHKDHRFEWSRAELESWANGVAARTGYGVRFLPVGPVDADVGPPTQMAVFAR